MPSDGRNDLLLPSIDLVEALAHGRAVRPIVDQLLVDSLRAYRVLVQSCTSWLLGAQADPEVTNIVELVALESVTGRAGLGRLAAAADRPGADRYVCAAHGCDV